MQWSRSRAGPIFGRLLDPALARRYDRVSRGQSTGRDPFVFPPLLPGNTTSPSSRRSAPKCRKPRLPIALAPTSRSPTTSAACSPGGVSATRSNWPGVACVAGICGVFAPAMCGVWPSFARAIRPAPHEILDPRDLKYCRNRCSADWHPQDDPFHWREQLPLARWGLAELQLMGYPLVALTMLLAWVWWPAAVVPAVILILVVYFFRDPPRTVPGGPGLLVSPADGVVAEITPLEHDDFIGGPAVRIGIFLSIFNVHINRAPCRASVVRLHYSPGMFLNALNPESAIKNENLWIGLEQTELPHRRLVVRQIAGLFARRIVCNLRPGRSGRARPQVRDDQARFADGVDPGCRAGTGHSSGRGSKSTSRQCDCCPLRIYSVLVRLLLMRRIRTVAVFPTMFTLGNLVCGFFSIVVAARIDAPTTDSISQPVVSRDIDFKHPTRVIRELNPDDPTQNIMLSGWLIFLAMVFDALDGHLARLSRATSDFGAQLDSLCDVVTFGVAPGFLLVKMCPQPTFQYRDVIWIIGASFAACLAAPGPVQRRDWHRRGSPEFQRAAVAGGGGFDCRLRDSVLRAAA